MALSSHLTSIGGKMEYLDPASFGAGMVAGLVIAGLVVGLFFLLEGKPKKRRPK